MRRSLEKLFIIDLIITSPNIKNTIIWYILRINYLSILNYELIIVS